MTSASTATTPAPSTEELRLSALHHAVQTVPTGSAPAEVTAAAEHYLAFLTGTAEVDVEAIELAARKDLVRAIVDDLDRTGARGAAEHVRDRARLSGLLA